MWGGFLHPGKPPETQDERYRGEGGSGKRKEGDERGGIHLVIWVLPKHHNVLAGIRA